MLMLESSTDITTSSEFGVKIETINDWLYGKSTPTAKNLQNLVNGLGYEFKIDGEVVRTDTFVDWMCREAKRRSMTEGEFSLWCDLCIGYIANLKKQKYIYPCTMQYIIDKCGKEIEIVKIA